MEEYVGSKGASDGRRNKDVKDWNSPVLVCSSCWGKKTPKSGKLTEKFTFISYNSGGWKYKNRGISRVVSFEASLLGL